MIIGLGIDAVEVDRFEHWHTYNHKKLSKFFAQEEIDYCLSLPIKSAERFAVRFAAKEAGMKAIGTGWHGGVRWQDFEVVNERSGRPTLRLSGVARDVANDLRVSRIHLSLTHTAIVAMAVVLLESD